MASLIQLLSSSDRAGVYQTAIDTDEIAAAAKTIGLPFFRVNLSSARGKSGLLDRIAKALRFPAHFGRNWDALNDCLSDLAWLDGKGWLLILTGADDFVGEFEPDLHTAIDVFTAAAEYWRERKKPFWVLIQASADRVLDLPRMVAD